MCILSFALKKNQSLTSFYFARNVLHRLHISMTQDISAGYEITLKNSSLDYVAHVQREDVEKSPVLRAMLNSGMREATERSITLQIVESSKVLRALEQWLCFDELSKGLSISTLQCLAQAADFLLLDPLLHYCTQILAAQLHLIQDFVMIGARLERSILKYTPSSQLLYAEEFLNRGDDLWDPGTKRESFERAWLKSGVKREDLITSRLQKELTSDIRWTPFVQYYLPRVSSITLRQIGRPAEELLDILMAARQAQCVDLAMSNLTGQDLLKLLPVLAPSHLQKLHKKTPQPPSLRVAGRTTQSPRQLRVPQVSNKNQHLLLKLANVNVGSIGIQALCKFAATHSNFASLGISKLDLSDNPLGDLGICKLAEALSATNVCVTELCLDRNERLEDASLANLVRTIRTRACAGIKLHSLSLRGLTSCNMNSITIQLFAPSTASEICPDFAYFDIGSSGSTLISPSIDALFGETRQRLMQLDLSGNHLEDTAVTMLCTSLMTGKAPVLETLRLACCKLTKKSVEHLCSIDVLKACKTLQCLDVSRNHLPCAATARLSQVILHCSSLRILNLSRNGIDAFVSAAFASALAQSNSLLQELNLSSASPRMGSQGCAALCRGIIAAKKPLQLQKIYLKGQHIQCRGAALLAIALHYLPLLQTLDLRDNLIQDTGILALREGVRHTYPSKSNFQVMLTGNTLSEKAKLELRDQRWALLSQS